MANKSLSKTVKLRSLDKSQESGLMKAVVWVFINIAALYIVEFLLPGFIITNFSTAFVAAIVIGVINTYIRPVVQLISLPLSIVTLGIFAFIVNVLMLMLASWIVPGFEIVDFGTAVLASILLTLIGWFFRHISK